MNRLVKDMDLQHAHMGAFNRRNILRVDPVVVLLVLALMVSGLFVLFSATHSGTSNPAYFTRQFLRAVLGTILAVLLICTDYRVLVSLAPVAYIGGVSLLVCVLLFGYEAKGGQHWLNLGFVRLQPSEFGKIVLVYSLAWYFSLIKERVRSIPFFILALVLSAVLSGLVVLQGDLGTAVVFGPVILACVFVAGARWWHLLLIVLIGLACIPVAWTQLSENQKDRIRTFMDPTTDTRGKAWQTTQTKIAVGSGGFWGKGYRQGTQTQLSYLPENHTDFIFSLLAEEGGFVGSTVILGVFALLFLRCLALAIRSPDVGGTVLTMGCVMIIAVHVLINVAITVGLLPVTGLPLPFFSYGGSFYLTTMMCFGTILSVHVRRRRFE